MNKRRRLLLAVLLLLAGGYFAYNYMYKEHRDISSETSKLEISASYLLERYKTNDGDELLNTTITVNGLITQVEEGTVTLDSGVHCSLIDGSVGLVEGSKMTIKGRCIGYDDLFEIVKLDQCTIIK